MPFSDDVKQQAFTRSEGRCECTSTHTGVSGAHHRGFRCPNPLDQNGSWELRHKVAEMAGGTSTLDNSQVTCLTCNDMAGGR